MSTTANEELACRFQHFTWRSEDDSCVIARVVMADGKPATLKGSPEAGPRLVRDGAYRFHGRWEDHEKFGRQFAFVSFSAVAGHDRNGVVAYLTSVAENVGEKRAAALWDRYGALAVTTLRENPQAVAEAGIMSLDAASEASESLRQEVAFEATRIELLGLLSGRGFQLSRLIRECLVRMSRQAPTLIRANPYVLLLGGYVSCGWKRCDRLYLDLGCDPAAMQRQALCAVYHLREQANGNTWLPVDPVGEFVVQAIGAKADPTAAIIMARDALGLIETWPDGDGRHWIAEAVNANDEADVADKIKELIGWQPITNEKQSSQPFSTLWLGDPELTSSSTPAP